MTTTDERYYFTDTVDATLEYAGEGTLTTDNFSPSDAETVTRDGPWADFFDTNEFVQFDATVAKPIVQPYMHKGKLRFFKKDEAEFKRTQGQIANLPWTMEHPDEGRITTLDEIRGIWDNPRYEDGQEATLHVPVNDPEAIQFAVDSQGVSMGFSGTIEWVDDESYDGIQKGYVYDHIASVDENPPRCPPEQGCGLHTDAAGVHDSFTDGHGHTVHDAVQTPTVEDSSEWSVGDWVSFHADGERHHGKITYVDAERALVKKWDAESEELTDKAIAKATASLSAWQGPFTDSCDGICHCGCHDAPFLDDAPDGIYVEDGDWYAISPENSGEDGPDYRLNDCDDVADAWGLVENGDYSIDQSTLEARIKRAAQAHDCSAEYRPWNDDSDTETDTTDSMTTIHEFLDENDVTREDVLDSLDAPNDPTDFYDGQPSADDLAEDFDAVDLLLDSKNDLEEQVEDLEDSLAAYEKQEAEAKIEELTDLTDNWDEEELKEQYNEGELSLDRLDERIELAKDIAGSETTTVDQTDDADGGSDDDESAGRFDLREKTA